MQLHSMTFLCFFGCLLLLYYTVPRRAQKPLLLFGSIIFYTFSGWRNVLLILSMTALAYAVAREIDRVAHQKKMSLAAHEEWSEEQRKAFSRRSRAVQRRWMLLGVAILLLGLSFFKFAPAVAKAVGTLPRLSSLIFPMGISFFTFQLITYVVDVYRGKVACERSFYRLCLFSCYFPQLVQGPISRYGELSATLYTPVAFDAGGVSAGMMRVAWGYLKKLVIADTAMIAVGTIMENPERFPGVGVLLLLVLYTVQIYGDFTGGMDIAIGCSEMLGIRLRENFLHPFASTTVGEYWRRWHITMSTFFTDYVFYPLSLSKTAQWVSARLRRVLGARWATQVTVWMTTLLTWLLTGIWHGAGLNFALWGLLNGVVMILGEQLVRIFAPLRKKFPHYYGSGLHRLLCCVRTFLIVGLLRTLDVYRNVPLTFSLWGSLFDLRQYGALLDGTVWSSLGLSSGQWWLLALGVLLMAVVGRLTLEDGEVAQVKWGAAAQTPPRWGSRFRDALGRRPMVYAVLMALMLAVIVIFGRYGYGYDASDFIYNQF